MVQHSHLQVNSGFMSDLLVEYTLSGTGASWNPCASTKLHDSSLYASLPAYFADGFHTGTVHTGLHVWEALSEK
jgi:hypothetical protein